jgi:signal transduction histidine kinase
MGSRNDLTLPELIHDLNNVFQTLMESADVLAGDPRWADLSSAILRSVERGRHISASLAGGGGRSAPFETILANAISFVEDSMLGQRLRAGRRVAIRFACDVEPGIELRHGWAWERVLINLFLNSKRAMPKGGTIRVSARRKPGQIEIAVRDDGMGIAAELMERLFQPGVSGFGSSGLGLHIVETIVKQDGGTVTVANLRRGAEFSITLPASAAIPKRGRTARPAGAGS